MTNQNIPLMVTTLHRGVFFGYGRETDAKTIRLENVRMCLYWPTSNKGVVGLAADGPAQGARVGPKAPSILIQDVTAVFRCTPAAAQAWESAPWYL